MVDPTSLTLSLNSWQLYLGIATFGFFSALGAELCKYAFERWTRKHLDKLNIEIAKDGIEVTTKKTLHTIGNKRIYRDEDEQEYEFRNQ